MATSFACSSCGLAIPFSQGEPGKAARCPSCGAAVAAALASSHASGADARRSSSSDRIGGTDALALEVAQARSDSSRRFGSFLLLSEIGRGGMGVVHRAFDERLRRVVALKRIHDDGADPRRFRKEAETAARLSHPAIVKIFDTGDVDGKLYLSMELVVGKTLAERRLPLTKALEALHRCCLAVQYAHEQGVIHRDLKPQNVIIEDGTGAPRLLDFGLARQVDGTRLTKTGTTLGTPAFMPPEQAGGAREEIDARSDVYSLGATLYYILTDRPPFEGATAYNVVAAVLTKDPIAPGELNPRAKGDLETIAQKCLEKEKRRRYGSAEALAQDLERYLAGQPILARPIGRFERGRRWVKRNRLPAAGALAVLVSIAGSGGFLGWERRARLRSGRETAASEAERSRKAFEKGSSSADETIGRGLDALEAASRLVALDAGEDAKRRACETAIAVGDRAAVAEQWTVAAHAYRRAVSFSADDKLARSKLEGLEARRTQALKDHEKTIQAILADTRSGALARRPNGPEDALYVLVALREEQTVKLLAGALDDVRGRLPKLDDGEAALARLSCDALGRIGIRPVAVDALGRYLERERDELRAARAAQALCRLGGEPAERFVLAAQDRLGPTFWGQVRPFFSLTGVDAKLEATTLLGYMRRGADRLDKGDVEGAIADYSRAIELEPGFGPAWFSRSVAREAKRDRAGAIADLSRAIELCPREAKFLANRGVARLSSGDADGAIADLTLALELEPASSQIRANRGYARHRKGDVEGAIADYSRALELDARDALTWVNRARARGDADDPEGAIQDASRALELDPRFALAWQERGNARQRKGDLDGAIADYSRAVELDPGLAHAWGYRGTTRGQKGDNDGAIADCTRAIELDPAEPHAWYVRGLARRGKGDLDGARADLKRYLELAPANDRWVSKVKAWLEENGG